MLYHVQCRAHDGELLGHVVRLAQRRPEAERHRQRARRRDHFRYRPNERDAHGGDAVAF